MATNTNYTTKTAALKATKADMRQVAVSKKLTSKEVWVDDAEGVSTNVLELIGDAQSAATSAASGALSAAKTELEGKITAAETAASGALSAAKTELEGKIQKAQADATAAAGIVVERDLNQDYDSADAGEKLETKIQGMKFYGEYVNVVDNEDGTVSLFFGKNNNPAEFSSTSGPAGSGMYVYSASGVSLGGITAGSYHSNCQAGGTESISATVDSSGYITIPNKTTKIKVEAIDNSGNTIAVAETAAIDGAGANETTGVAPNVTASSAAVSGGASAGAITITVSSIILNNSSHAKDGLTPGFIRCKIGAVIDNAKLLPSGGYYKVKTSVGAKNYTHSTAMFVYKAATTNPSIDTVTATYTSTGTKQVSGITYDSAAKVVLNVTGIKNTQHMVTTNLNRIHVSDNSNGRLGDIGNVAIGSLTAADKTIATAEYSLVNKEVTFTASHTPAVMSGKYIVTPLAPVDGSQYTNGKKESSFAGTRYLWNGTETADSDAKANFHTDGTRLAYTVLTDASGNVTGLDLTTTATYDKSVSLVDSGAYKQQLLIQGEKLKHPGGASMDVTGTYSSSNCTGTRYWTKLIKVGTSGDAKTTYTITGSNLNASGVKIWAVCANTDATATAGAKSLLINALGSAGGFAKSVSGTSLSVEIPGGQMTCKQNSCFYLVVQLPAGSTVQLGAITVA